MNATPKATFYLAELAEMFIKMKYEGQNVPIYNIKDEEDEMRYTDKIQDEFNEVYSKIETYLLETQI